MDIEQVKCMAQDNGWELLRHDPEQKLYRFVRDGVILDYWDSKKQTVAYHAKHIPRTYVKYCTEQKLDKLLCEL